MARTFSRDLLTALDRLYMDAQSFKAAFKRDPATTISTFLDDPTRFGPLRTYVGALSVKTNITRVRRLLLKLQRELNHSLTSD